MRVLMVGATGRHAHWVLRELIRRGVEVRALVRNEERAQVARRNGAAHYDRHGLPGGNALVLRAILGPEPRSLRDYFAELAAS
ncbi:MAG: NmrA family NAD(P)-binding protein [Mycobacterium sp.]